ncbi:carboxymuconolactone decarboxylase family protein [Limibacillus halophilus]|uniref:4-carboxymuconolactone decarboxylase n=1 Tax=Limibacillus halophilus TaxID=1579333 RepID=A0A839SUA8_9PROT|nr:carboxymuconolactone decarboxylase family protein [Limibacillus halophilus]MBB3064513.1 4-carboxymuconolactone decarboxylase [Limibacillus halophilus]
MDRKRYEAGLSVRTEVLGKDYVEKAVDGATDFTRPFQELVSEYCWGVAWSDDTLSRRERSLINLGMIAALGRMEEFALHFRGARRNGLSEKELQAVLIQIAVYCGIPAGVECFRIAKQILEEEQQARL